MKLPFSEEKSQTLGEKFAGLVAEKLAATPFVPGALEFIKKYHGTFTFFMASGAPPWELKEQMEARGIQNYFMEVHGSGRSKTEIIQGILDRYGYAPEEVVFIGDAHTDMDASRETGVHFIARLKDQNFEPGECANSLNDLTQLEEILFHIRI